MFGRKILFLAAGYVAGNVIASMYSDTKKKKGQSPVKGFFKTQQNLIADIENKYLSEEGKKSVENLKTRFTGYVKKGENIVQGVLSDDRVKDGLSKVQEVADTTYKQGKGYISTAYEEVKSQEKNKQKKDSK